MGLIYVYNVCILQSLHSFFHHNTVLVMLAAPLTLIDHLKIQLENIIYIFLYLCLKKLGVLLE